MLCYREDSSNIVGQRGLRVPRLLPPTNRGRFRKESPPEAGPLQAVLLAHRRRSHKDSSSLEVHEQARGVHPLGAQRLFRFDHSRSNRRCPRRTPRRRCQQHHNPAQSSRHQLGNNQGHANILHILLGPHVQPGLYTDTKGFRQHRPRNEFIPTVHNKEGSAIRTNKNYAAYESSFLKAT